MLIDNGIVITGTIDKKTVGNAGQGLIHLTWLEKGARFVSATLFLFLCTYTFLFSLSFLTKRRRGGGAGE